MIWCILRLPQSCLVLPPAAFFHPQPPRYWVRPEFVTAVKYVVSQRLPVSIFGAAKSDYDARSDAQLVNSVCDDEGRGGGARTSSQGLESWGGVCLFLSFLLLACLRTCLYWPHLLLRFLRLWFLFVCFFFPVLVLALGRGSFLLSFVVCVRCTSTTRSSSCFTAASTKPRARLRSGCGGTGRASPPPCSWSARPTATRGPAR